MKNKFSNKIAVKLTFYFAAVLLTFSLIMGALFYQFFKQHNIDLTKKENDIMKRTLIFLAFVLAAAFSLVGCGPDVPPPEIREGEFNVTVPYEKNGELNALELVYVYEYDGIGWTMDGTYYRDWNGYFVGYSSGDVIEICNTDDGKIALSFLIYPEYFMGEPDYVDDFYPEVLTNLIYYEDGNEMINDDQALIAEDYGIRIIGIEYDEPIENSFGSLK